MHHNDTEARRLIAAERFQRLRDDARGDCRPAGAARRRLGALLVSAGARIAPDEMPRFEAPLNDVTSGRCHGADSGAGHRRSLQRSLGQ
jgi:hypothetical protein